MKKTIVWVLILAIALPTLLTGCRKGAPSGATETDGGARIEAGIR